MTLTMITFIKENEETLQTTAVIAKNNNFHAILITTISTLKSSSQSYESIAITIVQRRRTAKQEMTRFFLFFVWAHKVWPTDWI